MFTVIAAIVALAGTAIATGVSASSSNKAIKAQNKAWREEMNIEAEQRKKDNHARSMKMFQDTINRSGEYKKQVGALWAGRTA